MIDEARSLPLPLWHLHRSARAFATEIRRWEQAKKREQCQYLCSLFIHFHNERGVEGGQDLISVEINDNCSSGRILQLLQYPIHKVLCARIDTRHIGTSTADAVANDSNEIETLFLDTAIVDGHQRTTGIALARVLAAGQDASTDHCLVELILAEVTFHVSVFLLTDLIPQHGHHQFLQHQRRLATLLRSAPARDKRIGVHIRFGTQLWCTGHADGCDQRSELHIAD